LQQLVIVALVCVAVAGVHNSAAGKAGHHDINQCEMLQHKVEDKNVPLQRYTNQ
jgi:hypothetical protein